MKNVSQEKTIRVGWWLVCLIGLSLISVVQSADPQESELQVRMRDQYYHRGRKGWDITETIRARELDLSLDEQRDLNTLLIGHPYPWAKRSMALSDWITRGLLGTIQRPIKHIPTDYNKWTHNNSILVTYSPLNGYFQMLHSKGISDLRLGVIHLGDVNCTQDISWYSKAHFVLRDHNCDSGLWSDQHRNVFFIPMGWKNNPMIVHPEITPQTISERLDHQSPIARENWDAIRRVAFSLATESAMALLPSFGRRYVISFVGQHSRYRSDLEAFLSSNFLPTNAIKLVKGEMGDGFQQPIFYFGTLTQSAFSMIIEFNEPVMPSESHSEPSTTQQQPTKSQRRAKLSAQKQTPPKEITSTNPTSLYNATHIHSYETHRIWDALESGALPISRLCFSDLFLNSLC